jgi:hypothetical protein
MYDSINNINESISTELEFIDLPERKKAPAKIIFIPVAGALLSLITSKISIDDHLLFQNLNELTNSRISLVESYSEVNEFNNDDAPLVIPYVKKVNVIIGQVKKLKFNVVEDENGFV